MKRIANIAAAMFYGVALLVCLAVLIPIFAVGAFFEELFQKR